MKGMLKNYYLFWAHEYFYGKDLQSLPYQLTGAVHLLPPFSVLKKRGKKCVQNCRNPDGEIAPCM